MSLLVPAPRTQYGEYNYSGRPTTTWGTTITASGTTHTRGTRSQIVASTTRPYNRIRVTVHSTAASATVTDILLSIYLGGAGSEVVLIPNLQVGWMQPLAGGGGIVTYEFPVYIPKGSRISADSQSAVASKACYVMLEMSWLDNAWAGAGVETLGAVTSGASRGTAVTPGTTSDGTWTSIGTSGRLYRAVLPVMGAHTDTTLATASGYGLDIGTGSALIAGLGNFLQEGTTGEALAQQALCREVTIASGTALQARLQSHTTEAEAKYVTIHGVY